MRRPLALALALLLLSLPATAYADGDPASDILLGQDVFYPYAPNVVSKPLQAALNAMTVASKKKGFPVKVALIASAGDMGSVPQLFTDPQRYADLLTQEISFNSKPRVLVVLPAGIGGNNLGDNAGPALTSVTVPDSADADALARTALTALGRLTAAAGKPVPVPPVATSASKKGGSGTSPLIVFGVPVALVAMAAALAATRGRRDETDEDEPAAE
jgi:hypothetical protein